MSVRAAEATRAPAGPGQRTFEVLLVGLLSAAGFYWTRFLSVGAPFVYHPDEPAVVARAVRIALSGDPNPRWFHYPSLCIYLQAAVAALLHGARGVALGPGAILPVEGASAAALPFYVWGRGLTVVFAIGTTYLVVRMAQSLAGPWWGLVAGAVFATSALVFRSAVYVTVDMPLTFFVALSTLLMMRVASAPARARDMPRLLGAVLSGGLAAGAKYNGALVLLVLAVVVLTRRGASWRTAGLLLGFAALSIAVFVVTTPFAVLDPAHFWSVRDGLPAELLHYRSGHLGADQGSALAKMLLALFSAASPVTLLALVVIPSFPFLASEDRAGALVAWLVVLVLALPISLSRVFFERNCVPLLPPLLALAALGAALIARALRSASTARAFQIAAEAIVALGVGALHFPRSYDVARSELASRYRVDPRTAAHDWAMTHIPPGSRILREAFAPHLHLTSRFAVTTCFAVGQLSRQEVLSGYDYVITTSTMWQGYPDLAASTYGAVHRDPPAFIALPPALPAFHDWPIVRIDRLTTEEPPDLDSRAVFRLSETDGFADVLPGKDVVIDAPPPNRAGILNLVATGNDPSVLLPEMPPLAASRYLLRVWVQSPTDTTLQLFYRPTTSANYDEAHSVRRRLVHGENHVELTIGPSPLVGRLRLDPGDEQGVYGVSVLALYALPL